MSAAPAVHKTVKEAVPAAAKRRGAALINFCNMAHTKEKSVRAQINGLAIGAEARFPLARYDYVVSCRTRLQMTTGKRFSSSIDNEAGEVVITRNADEDKADAMVAQV